MSVRAKFKLTRYETYMVSQSTYNEGKEREHREVETRNLFFQAVHGNSPENAKFFTATPSGEVKLGVTSPEAWGQFELNKEYYLDFTPAEVSDGKLARHHNSDSNL